jgi:penicillin-binding protein 1B
MAVGLDRVLKTISDLGVTRELPAYPSILLGASGLAPIEIAAMYQTIAAGGFDAPLRSIRAVTNAHGEPLSRYPLNIEQRFSPEQIHLIYYALQETMREGTGKSAYKSLPSNLNIAGKTGSTDDLRDSWFAGFTGDRLSVVWLGNDDNSPTGLTGSRGGLQIWVELMRRLQPQPFTGVIPANIEYLWIDEATGLVSSKRCMGARYMPFIKGSGPSRKASCTSRASELGEWIRSWFD